MSSTLTLTRENIAAIELRRGPFEIVLDGNPAGSIARTQTVELELQPGPHTLQVRAGLLEPGPRVRSRGRHRHQVSLQ